MVPCMKEKIPAVITSQPPQTSRAARVPSVRGARRVNQRPATSSTAAAGSSQEISGPKPELNIRSTPVEPPNMEPPPPPPPPPLPEPPKIRPRPLYPKTSSQKELFSVPAMYGRESAGQA
ncbi:Uncharacterised protein [Mycobacteroides abscessus subsp. abscessus]|nr:Uncharacterised protein [Mycobacteroides abscessus subsp. abscessus]